MFKNHTPYDTMIPENMTYFMYMSYYLTNVEYV